MRWAVILLLSVLSVGCVHERISDDNLDENKRTPQEQAQIRAELAANYLQRGELKVALDEVEEALKLDADNAAANYIMALIQMRFKDKQKVEHYFRKAIRRPDPLPNAQQDYANYLCGQKDYKQAFKEFEALHDNPIYPNQELVYLNEAECHLLAHQKDRAEQALRKALKINPRLVPALYHMTVLSFESGNMLQTRAWYQRYMELGRDDPRILYIAYQTEKTLGDKNAAASLALRLKGKFPDSEQARLLRGNR